MGCLPDAAVLLHEEIKGHASNSLQTAQSHEGQTPLNPQAFSPAISQTVREKAWLMQGRLADAKLFL